MTVGSDDDLAHTATVGSEPRGPDTKPLAATLGRYRLEQKLGEGGMGVVHAAFDPDLERRIALKVLRTDAGTGEARQRLLREARAMARLAHANVVTVHEVGSEGGRDYVAMELIDGDSLAEWLRSTPRPPRDIVAAFVAAGRGLAAAHAAGLVHRDFKPHNVLRGRDGRVVVTDFGLARGVETAVPTDAFEVTAPLPRGVAMTSSTPSSLSGLTVTGSVLGTPAYMAPEQWNAQSVGPAADQFAFCVALWEALVGTRPYRGDTIEQLKASVMRGPLELDTSKLPRHLRAALRRGLDPDPAKRWPDMNALLAHLANRPATVAKLVALGAGLIVAGIVVYVATRPAPAAVALCDPPARDVATVWPAGTGAAFVAAGRGELGKAFERDLAAWTAGRAQACALRNPAQLACLDGVVARLDTIHRAIEKVPGEVTDAAIGALVDPAVCATGMPPRLTVKPTADTIAAYALLLDAAHPNPKLTEAEAATFAARPELDPCARGIAQLAFDTKTHDQPLGKAATLDAIAASEACGDDRLHADAVLAESGYENEAPYIGPRGVAALRSAKSAVDRIGQVDVVAHFELKRAQLAGQQEHWSEAFAAADSALEKFGARGRTHMQITAAEMTHGLRFRRNDRGDMEAVRASVAKWRPVAAAMHDDDASQSLAQTDAYARLFLGDLAGAHPEILRLWTPSPHPGAPVQRIEGTVVDEHGRPVPGATVAAASPLFLDSVGPIPFSSGTENLRIAKADEHGAFTIADAAVPALVIAQSDAHHRSLPVRGGAALKLVLAPTRHLAGKVELGGAPASKSFVMASLADSNDPGRYVVMSPIAADGTFSLDGVATVNLKIGVATWGAVGAANLEFVPIPAGTADSPAIALRSPRSARTLDVITRSAVSMKLDGAQVIVLAGKYAIATAGELNSNHHIPGLQVQWARPLVGETMPKAALGKTLAGDLVAHFTDVAAGDLTVCVLGLSGDIMADPRLAAHLDELALKCASPGPTDEVMVIEAPPQKRFD